MTKWHRYRDIKPSIKDIVKSKENSSDVISERREASHKKRLFLKLVDIANNNLSSEKILEEYIVFSKVNDSMWIPINLLDENRSMSNQIAKELHQVIEDGKVLWIYISTNKQLLESDEIQFKAKVTEVTYSEIEKQTPDDRFTLKIHQDDKSKLWIKVGKMKKCGGVSTKDLCLVASDISLKDDIRKLDLNFGYVERLNKHKFTKNIK